MESVLDRRAERIYSLIEKFIPENSKVLDIGAGDCRISKLISERKKAEVVPLEVFDRNVTDLKIVLYDGNRIPFKDGSFDIVLSSFVISRTKNPENYVDELFRMAKNRVIILEDTPKDWKEMFLKRIWDLFAGGGLFCYYKSCGEWMKKFNEMNLNVEFAKKFRSVGTFSVLNEKSLFVVEKLK